MQALHSKVSKLRVHVCMQSKSVREERVNSQCANVPIRGSPSQATTTLYNHRATFHPSRACDCTRTCSNGISA